MEVEKTTKKNDLFPLMNLAELLNASSGKLLVNFSNIDFYSSVVVDSRFVKENSLFIPLRGENQDGHIYIEEALQNGADYCLVDFEFIEKNENKILIKNLCKKYSTCCIAVKNNLYALQDIAKKYLEKYPKLYKIGITGSSGKTTTKEILASIYSKKYKTVINEGNLNSETGLPLSVFKVRSNDEVGIFELGMNRRGEINEIASVLLPNAAIITNIGTAHIGILGSKKAIAEEKKEIFSNFNDNCFGLIPQCEFSHFLKDGVLGQIEIYSNNKNIKKIEDAGIAGSIISYKNEKIKFPLVGKYNSENAIACIALAEKQGFSASEIKDGLEAVQPLFGRSQVKHSFVTYLFDCYNANPDSMEKAIYFSNSVSISGFKHFVIASMLELGSNSDDEHKKIIELALNSSADFIYFFGDEFTANYNLNSDEQKKVFVFESNEFESLYTTVEKKIKRGDFVLLKGSRGLALERLEPVLQNKKGEADV